MLRYLGLAISKVQYFTITNTVGISSKHAFKLDQPILRKDFLPRIVPSSCCFRNQSISSQIYTTTSYSASSRYRGTISTKRAMSDQTNFKADEESLLSEKYKPRELSVKTPYGHIALMEWGQSDAPYKIFCSHGWLDNAGSFERLIPFILDYKDNSTKYHIVAMDMPGVGHSSHKPPGGEYTPLSIVMEMRRVLQHLGWNKVTLLSHSLGSHVSFFYSAIYPEQTETMVSIDLTHPITRHLHNWNVTIASSIEDHFKAEYNQQDNDPTTDIRVPVYSETDALKRLMDAHSSSLTLESAKVLLKRGATKQSWGYTFNRDARWRSLSLEFRPDDDMMLKLLQNTFKPNLFIIKADKSPYHRPEEIRMQYYKIFEKNCRIFRETMLEGTHHLHMNTPKPVATAICEFLDLVRNNGDKKVPITTEGTVNMNKSNL